ncbi:MAG: single-stranded DNA-binding protein [Terracidiphilus sp.]
MAVTPSCWRKVWCALRCFAVSEPGSSKLLIEGKIQTRTWDDRESGQKKYRTEIFSFTTSRCWAEVAAKT